MGTLACVHAHARVRPIPARVRGGAKVLRPTGATTRLSRGEDRVWRSRQSIAGRGTTAREAPVET